MTYSTGARLEFPLDEHDNLDSLQLALEGIYYRGKAGIQVMQESFQFQNVQLY